MTASKSLPARPSLDSLCKQAKKLSRDRSITLREAQLALARDYGFAGWQDLGAEVARRLGNELEWAADESFSNCARLVFEDDYEAMQFLIDRGIDMTIEDYRWRATAEGWALHGKGDARMAEWLEQARLRRASQ